MRSVRASDHLQRGLIARFLAFHHAPECARAQWCGGCRTWSSTPDEAGASRAVVHRSSSNAGRAYPHGAYCKRSPSPSCFVVPVWLDQVGDPLLPRLHGKHDVQRPRRRSLLRIQRLPRGRWRRWRRWGLHRVRDLRRGRQARRLCPGAEPESVITDHHHRRRRRRRLQWKLLGIFSHRRK